MKNVKKIVAEKILENLQNFDGLWAKPWFSTVSNPVTGTNYSGANTFTLGLLGKSGLFATYKQIEKEGGQVKKGAKSLPVIFYAPIEGKDLDKNGKPQTFPLMRYYNVFDLEDCEGVDHLKKGPRHFEHKPLSEAESLIKATGAKIEVSSDKCFYNAHKDYIGMVPMSRFERAESYYSTVFHELTHWTGHKSRLDRFESENVVFRSKEYAFEELVAELGACMLSQKHGILDAHADNSKAYLKGWFSRVKEKPEDLINALSKAYKAYKFLNKEGE